MQCMTGSTCILRVHRNEIGVQTVQPCAAAATLLSPADARSRDSVKLVCNAIRKMGL